VVIAKNNLPLVDLVIHKPEGKRKLGLLAGKYTVPESIMDEDAEINAMFYGNDDPNVEKDGGNRNKASRVKRDQEDK
jgi:hypothetical protein